MIHPYAHYPERAAQRWPQQMALVDGARRRTYEELDARTARLASALLRLGLRPGERVAIVQENCIEYVEAAIAIARAGGALVPLLGALTATEHAFMVSDAEARFVLALRGAAIRRARDAAATSGADVLVLDEDGATGAGTTSLSALAAREGERCPAVDRSPDSLAQILYTSGTTGHPKGVTHSFASVSAAMGEWASAFSVGRGDRLLGQLALSHFGGRAMDACWVAGATLVILPAAEPAAMLSAIAEHRITMMLVVPTLLRMLLDHSDAGSADLSSLRAVVYAAAPAAPALVRRSLDRLGSVLYTGFGQTEAYGLATCMGPEEHVAALEAATERLRSVGRECAAFAQVRICGEDGDALPPGEIGEVCVCAPWVTPGFWKRPDLDTARLRDGWLRTGDLGRVDEEGYVFLADRKEDKIITGGFNVYPAEVEAALSEHPAVAECAVFAVPDSRWGEAVRAAVTLRPGAQAEPDALLAFCRERLARFKVPKAIDVMSELPKSGVGKILRRVLRAPWWKDHEGDIHGAE
ncbi:MAG: AMP-binding protein [Deltaproteobacteria bacterium]|nr:AMP-binding protein [Deltaproteobacteria bacterium]